MTLATDRDPRGDNRESGFTLTELLVVIVILGIVGSIVTTGIVSSFRVTSLAQARIAALNDLEKGLERITRELRAASPILIDPTADYDSRLGATVIRAGAEQDFFYRTEVRPDGDFDLFQYFYTVDASGTVITTDGLFIARIEDDQIFRYFDNQGVEITCTTTDDACRFNRGQAAKIRITLRKVLDTQEPLRVETEVNVRSARFP